MTAMTPTDARIAQGFLQDALKLDPNYAAAQAFLAWCHEICYMRAGFDDADKVAGLRHARGAIESGTDAAAEPIRSRGLCSAYCARTRGGRRGALRRGGVTISSRLSFDPECAPNARR